jgi:hypothetical protein
MSPVGPTTWVQPPLYLPPKTSLVGCANLPPEVAGVRWQMGARFDPEYGNGDDFVYDPSVSATVGQILTVTNKALTTNVATITTAIPHLYTVGESVVVYGVDATFNGQWVITTVPSTTTFTYADTAANVVSVAATGSVVSVGEATVAVAPMALSAVSRKRTAIGWAVQDYKARAVRRLRVSQYTEIEEEFWTGSTISGNPSLVSTATVAPSFYGGAVPAAAVSPPLALGILEAAAGQAGAGRIMIHCTPRVFAGLVKYRQVLDADVSPLQTTPGDEIQPSDGKQLEGGPAVDAGSGQWLATETLQPQNPGTMLRAPMTRRGSIVVAGGGYTGTGPTGNAGAAVTATAEWMYATGPVDVRLDTIDVQPDSLAEATDRTTNTVVFRAGRRALVTFDPLSVFAVQVDLTNV